jgi:hypothetical protein
MMQMVLHPAECDEDCASESISDTKNSLNLNGDLDHPNVSEGVWEVDDESD